MLRQQFQSAVIVAGAMVCGWVIAWLTLDFGEGSEPDASAVQHEPAQLEALEREVGELRRELQTQAGRPDATREVVREIRVEGPAGDEQLPEILQRDPDSLSSEEFEEWRTAELDRQAAIFDGFDERLANETRDQDWAPRAESSIARQLAQLQAQGFETTQLTGNECGSRTCRAEFIHADPEEQRRFLHELRPEGEFVQADVHIVTDADGTLRTEAFFTRHDGVS